MIDIGKALNTYKARAGQLKRLCAIEEDDYYDDSDPYRLKCVNFIKNKSLRDI